MAAFLTQLLLILLQLFVQFFDGAGIKKTLMGDKSKWEKSPPICSVDSDGGRGNGGIKEGINEQDLNNLSIA
jgi:hypothetical protein